MIETINTVEIAKCRKRHRCDDCLRMIEVREPYTVTTLVDGGAPYRWSTCQYCEAWRDALLTLCDPSEELGRGWVMNVLDGCAYNTITRTYEVAP
jgi:hypothetical protein